MPKGPSRKVPPPRSSRLPKMLGESNRGTHSQSTAPSGATRAPVWQSERKAYSAMGGKGDGSAALCSTMARFDARRPPAASPGAGESGRQDQLGGARSRDQEPLSERAA